MSSVTDQLSEMDERLLRRAIELSAQAVADGNLPFGAVLADAGGNILLEAGTTGVTDNNVLYHAETNVMHAAMSALTAEERASGTLYSSSIANPARCAPAPSTGVGSRGSCSVWVSASCRDRQRTDDHPGGGFRRLPADPGTGCPGYRGRRAVPRR